jgi:hypothetical protein
VYRDWRPAKKRWLEQQPTFDAVSEGWTSGKKVRSYPVRALVAGGLLAGFLCASTAFAAVQAPMQVAFAEVGTAVADGGEDGEHGPEGTVTPTPSQTIEYTPTLTATAVPTETPVPTPLPVQVFNWETNVDNNPLNGYFQPDRGWIPGYIDDESWNRGVPTYSFGGAVWYAPNVMEGTARYRGLPLENYVDGVSLMAPSDIGETVWLRRPGHTWEGPFLVVDCAQANHHFAAVYYAKEIVEVGWTTAIRWGMVDEYQNVYQWRIDGIEVWKGVSAPPADPGVPVDYREWWLSQVTFQANPEQWADN